MDRGSAHLKYAEFLTNLVCKSSSSQQLSLQTSPIPKHLAVTLSRGHPLRRGRHGMGDTHERHGCWSSSLPCEMSSEEKSFKPELRIVSGSLPRVFLSRCGRVSGGRSDHQSMLHQILAAQAPPSRFVSRRLSSHPQHLPLSSLMSHLRLRGSRSGSLIDLHRTLGLRGNY